MEVYCEGREGEGSHDRTNRQTNSATYLNIIKINVSHIWYLSSTDSGGHLRPYMG